MRRIVSSRDNSSKAGWPAMNTFEVVLTSISCFSLLLYLVILPYNYWINDVVQCVIIISFALAIGSIFLRIKENNKSDSKIYTLAGKISEVKPDMFGWKFLLDEQECYMLANNFDLNIQGKYAIVSGKSHGEAFISYIVYIVDNGQTIRTTLYLNMLTTVLTLVAAFLLMYPSGFISSISPFFKAPIIFILLTISTFLLHDAMKKYKAFTFNKKQRMKC